MLLVGTLSVDQLVGPKGFFKENGKTKPFHEKKGITEDQMNISVKGNNDTIRVVGKQEYDRDVKKGKGRNVKVLMKGTKVRVEQGSGINSGKEGVIVGIKPSDEFPKSATDWLQIKVEKPEIQKGIVISMPSDRLEVLHEKNFAPEIKRAYLDKKQDVDDLLKGRLDALRNKYGDDIVMQSIMLTARPFSKETTFVVTMTNPKTDKDYEQWYVNETVGKTTNDLIFELNRTR